MIHRSVKRFDAPAPAERGHAHAVVHAVALAQTQGTSVRRARIPKQNFPTALEAEYADKIIKLLERARSAYTKLFAELPRLLARAEASRSDRMDAAADLEERRFAGFDVVVENAAGTTRSWIDSDGTVGHTEMKFDYGYLADTLGADGEPVDVYLGPDEESQWVYAIHQNKKSDGFQTYDEDKILIGFSSSADAEAAYHAQYDDPRFFGGMSTFPIDVFRAKLDAANGDKITHREDAGETDFARSLVNQAAAEMRRDVSKEEVQKLATYFARATSQAQRRELAKQLTNALGVEVLPDESQIPQILEYFSHENATLIGSIPEEFHQEIAKLTARAFTKRMNPDTYANLLQDRFEVAESRARFLARDQLGKLWGQVNAVRQRSVGVDQFTWRDCGLDNVRPRHLKASGKVWSYEDPPAVGNHGERMLPGEDFGCRCTAEPVVTGILQAAKTLRGHSSPVGVGSKR